MKTALTLALSLFAGVVHADMSVLAGVTADVVILGETHDNPQHHLLQASAIGIVAPKAVVFEMLSADQAARITPDLQGNLEDLNQMLAWDNSGWPPFAEYAPIFHAAAAIPIYGGALTDSQIDQAFASSAASVFGADAAGYGLTQPLSSADQIARQDEQRSAHCGKLPEDLLPGMVQVQRARDAMLANAVIAALDDTGGPVVVITGSGHARRDSGIPAVLAVTLPELTVFSLSLTEQPLDADAPFDAWVLTEAVVRPDPCLAFQ